MVDRLGFIGVGIMGHPMAGHLIDAGYEVTVFDASDVAMERFGAAHPSAVLVEDAAAVGERADIVITMLPDGEQVKAAAVGARGLIETLEPGALLVDTSSAQPWLTLQTACALADRGVGMVDAPVSGAQWGAEAADLVFMVGGASADVQRVRPLLDRLARAVFHLGPLGSGHIMKCVNNTITAMTFIATLEGLALATRAGLDPNVANQVLNESTGGSWLTRNHIEQRILSRTFDDPFRLELMLKDIHIATQLARSLDVALPYWDVGAQMYEDANDVAGPGRSLSEIARWIEQRTGIDIGGAGSGSDPQHRI